jgi:hypothetical protein
MRAPRPENLEPPPSAHHPKPSASRAACVHSFRLGSAWVTADARSSVCRELDLVLVPG